MEVDALAGLHVEVKVRGLSFPNHALYSPFAPEKSKVGRRLWRGLQVLNSDFSINASTGTRIESAFCKDQCWKVLKAQSGEQGRRWAVTERQQAVIKLI
eukprot:1142062-Pelagomonas_calceolata.AAC.2